MAQELLDVEMQVFDILAETEIGQRNNQFVYRLLFPLVIECFDHHPIEAKQIHQAFVCRVEDRDMLGENFVAFSFDENRPRLRVEERIHLGGVGWASSERTFASDRSNSAPLWLL